jgi:hypothetical protein
MDSKASVSAHATVVLYMRLTIRHTGQESTMSNPNHPDHPGKSDVPPGPPPNIPPGPPGGLPPGPPVPPKPPGRNVG